MFEVVKLDRSRKNEIQKVIDTKTKPPGSLGELEDLAMTLSLVLSKNERQYEGQLRLADPIQINHPMMLVFAGDHGIAEENISIAPSEVTQQMVLNFLDGGAAINCFCRTNDMELEVIDAGILLPLENQSLVQQSLGRGTNNFVNQPAMSEQQVTDGLNFGKTLVKKHIENETNVFGFGDMGIGNTSSASAILCAITENSIENCVGRGTGISDEVLERKKNLLSQAVKFHQQRLKDDFSKPMQVMSSFAGFEIVQMVGAMLAAAENSCIVLVDGFIATAAAMLAVELQPNSRDYMVFCHQSSEQAHNLMLQHLSARPLLDLGLRLGEGTGAALALPVVRSAASFYNNMASFDSAGVTSV